MILGYGGFLFGFWLLFQSFSKSNPFIGVLGGGLILGAMSMTVVRRRPDTSTAISCSSRPEEDDSTDLINGCDKGSKLPP